MESESVFGVEPEQLNELLSVGEDDIDDSPAESEPSQNDRSSEEKPDSEPAVNAFVEQPGSWIGPYKLLRVLGEGGMGIAYLAEQKRPMRRQVAIKVIKPGMDSRRVISRFEAERQALALLDHPNIAHVHDAGTTELGRPYFVMEYVKGLSITDYCDHHKLTIKDRLVLFQQICHAIQHAHQKGIIHRDIKPSNILVSMENDQPAPKIIDFGVAKAIGRPLTDRTVFTEDRHLLGTPEYMSPEQADMATEDIDTRSDVYSLGVLLYVLLTGVLPFDVHSIRDSGIEKIRRTIRETDPKTPSTRLTSLGEDGEKVAEQRSTEIGILAKHLKKELEWIPLKAIRKERSERYRSASELADDIENYLNGVPLIAGPPKTIYRFKKFVRRNRVLSAAVLAVAVTLFFGLAATTAMYIRSERALGESQAIADFFTKSVLSAISDANANEQNLSYILDTTSNNLEVWSDKPPLVEASIRNTLGWTYKRIYQPAKAAQQLETALRIYEEHLGEGYVKTIRNMFALAHVYMTQNRWDDAERMLKRQAEIVQRENLPDNEIPLNALGCFYYGLGRYKEAEEALQKKLEIVRRNKGSDAGYGWYTANLARVYRYQGRYKEAENLYKKTSAMAGWDSNNSDRLLHTAGLANVYRDQCRYREAEELYKIVIEKQVDVYGEKRAVRTMIGLAMLYTNQGFCDKANELFGKIDEISGKSSKGESLSLSYIDTLAVLRTKQDRFFEAEELFERALEIRKQKYNRWADDHPGTLKTKNDLAVLYTEQARYDEVEELLLAAAEGRGVKLGDAHPHTQESVRNLIELYETRGKADEAAKWRAQLLTSEDRRE